MNIFNKVALQGLLKNRTRTIVTIIGVILSAAMITGVASFATSLQHYMINGSIMKYGDWHIGLSDVDDTFIEQQRKDDRIANMITFENLGYARLEEGKNENKPYLFFAGFNLSSYDELPITLTSGRLPENDTEIIIPSHLKDNAEIDISIGETMEISLGNRVSHNEKLTQYDPFTKNSETFVADHNVSYTVVGKYKRPAFENVSSPGYTLITTVNSANESNSYSAFIKLNKPKTVHAYENELQINNHKTVLNDDVLRFMGLSKDKTFNTLLYSVGAILVALIMLGSIFLIYNAFTISLNERMRQFGILLSVGATANQLRNSVLFEGLCIGLVGIPLGVLVGIPAVSGVLSLVSKNFNNFAYSGVPLELHVSLPIIICAIAISFITILVSAYIPAHKAAKTPVMTCIRQTNEIKVESKEIEIAKWIERLLGLERTLALKNFKRNKRRYRTIVLSLVLSVVMFVSASAFKTTLQQAADSSNISTDYDLLFFSENMKESEAAQLFEKFQNVEGIYESSYQAMVDYSTHVPVHNLTSYFIQNTNIQTLDEANEMAVDVQFIEDRLYFDFLNKLSFDPEEYTGDNAKVVAIAKMLSKDTTEYLDVFTKPSMSFVLSPQLKGNERVSAYPVEMTFVDTYMYDPLPVQPSKVKPYTFMVVVPYQQIEQWGLKNVQIDRGLTFQSNNTTASAKGMEKIAQELHLPFDYTIYNANEIFEQNRNIIFIVDLFTIVFVIMISLIAVANVFNTISTNIRLRRRELAMIRSIGMSDHDFNKMMRFECATYGFKTLILGIPISFILSWLIYKGMFSGGADVQYEFPWTSLIISISSVFLIIFITTMYAISILKKENIIDALRDDLN